MPMISAGFGAPASAISADRTVRWGVADHHYAAFQVLANAPMRLPNVYCPVRGPAQSRRRYAGVQIAIGYSWPGAGGINAFGDHPRIAPESARPWPAPARPAAPAPGEAQVLHHIDHAAGVDDAHGELSRSSRDVDEVAPRRGWWRRIGGRFPGRRGCTQALLFPVAQWAANQSPASSIVIVLANS